MLHIEMVGFFGVPRIFMPAFARFCFAFRLYSYFNLCKIHVKMNTFQQAAVDVMFVGGAFVHRREAIVARLYIAYSDVFDFPVALTDRPKEEGGDRYGYPYLRLIRPNRERGKVAILPAVRTSEARALLQAREDRQPDPKNKDFNVVTICFGAPLEHGVEPPPRSVGGSCT